MCYRLEHGCPFEVHNEEEPERSVLEIAHARRNNRTSIH